MALPSTFTQAYGQLGEFFSKIRDAQAPDHFTIQILKDLGFKSNNHRPFIPLMKSLGFLASDGTPTQRYHDYRNHSLSTQKMGEALKEAYSDIFLIKEKPTTGNRDLILGKFKSYHNASDNVAKLHANTFYALLNLASLEFKQQKQIKGDAEIETIKTPEQLSKQHLWACITISRFICLPLRMLKFIMPFLNHLKTI